MLHVGDIVGAYQITEVLGQGGMATVYKAFHAKLDRYVAIKMMHQALAQEADFMTRFEREAQIIARLEHPNIIPVYDFSEHEGDPYLVMKFVEGETLEDRLKRSAVPLADIQRIMTTVAGALTYAHEQGVLHRDVKPSNIILDRKDTPFLTDFGLARLVRGGASTLSQGAIIGTPHYISPEQAMGQAELDPRTDEYSFGVVLYQLVVGRVPYSGDTPFSIVHDHIYSPLPAPTSINADVPAQVEAVLMKALAKDPNDRYRTPVALMDAFREAASKSEPVGLPSDRAESVAPPPVGPRPPVPPAPPKDEPPVRPRRPKRKKEFEFNVGDLHLGNLENLGDMIEERANQFAASMEDWASQFEEGQAAGRDRHGRRRSKRPLTEEERFRRHLEKKFKERQGLRIHFAMFVMVNLLLWLIWAMSGGFLWPLIPMLGWGAGIVAHIMDYVYQFGRGAERREMVIQEVLEEARLNSAVPLTDAEEKKIRVRLERRFKEKQGLRVHLAMFAMVNLLLWFIWALSGGFLWPLIPMFGWGIGIVAHVMEYNHKYGGGARRREQEIQREMERARLRGALPGDDYEAQYPAKRKHEDIDEQRIRLTDDGEFTQSFVDELDDQEKPKRGRQR